MSAVPGRGIGVGNVVGVGRNRTDSSSRSDLVVAPGETEPFETTSAPFAASDGVDSDHRNGDDRTATIAIVNASSGRTTETITVRLDD